MVSIAQRAGNVDAAQGRGSGQSASGRPLRTIERELQDLKRRVGRESPVSFPSARLDKAIE